MIMRALVFLSCFKAYRKPSECVMYCTVEQVVGESDRFRANRNSDIMYIHILAPPHFIVQGP